MDQRENWDSRQGLQVFDNAQGRCGGVGCAAAHFSKGTRSGAPPFSSLLTIGNPRYT
jgi:hypothetical protein